MNKKHGNLVIVRNVGEAIVLEDGTEIYLSYASRGKARIAIKSHQAILRKELVVESDSFDKARKILEEKRSGIGNQ